MWQGSGKQMHMQSYIKKNMVIQGVLSSNRTTTITNENLYFECYNDIPSILPQILTKLNFWDCFSPNIVKK